MKFIQRKAGAILLILAAITSLWFFKDSGKSAYTFYGDALGYYMCLPSTWI